MKNLHKIITAIVLLILSISVSAQDKTNDKPSKTKFSIEIDPATFAFNGYGVHLRIQPKNTDHILVGAGIYAMDFPDLFVNINSENKDKGWDVKLSQGTGLFGEYHFSELNKKWFIGTQLARQEYTIKNSHEIGSEKFNTFLGLGYGGYTIQPFKNNGLYVKLWAGMGYTAKTGGENQLGNSLYDVSPILLFSAIHLGYTF